MKMFVCSFALLFVCSNAASQATKNTPQIKPQSATINLPRKPQAEDRNPDGSDRFKTYEDYVEALTDWKTRQVLSTFAHVPSVTINEPSEANPSEIAALKKEIESLKAKLQLDEIFLSNKLEKSEEVSLDPARMDVYQRLDSDPLQFLVSLKSIVPYLDGYKAVINVGNPSSARFRGIKVKCKWSKAYDWKNYSEASYKAWQSAIHKSEVEVQTDIAPGYWNPVEVILLPANPQELGYFVVSIESNTVSLTTK
jgi:Protein of unknown function (DUF3251).